MALFTVEGQAK